MLAEILPLVVVDIHVCATLVKFAAICIQGSPRLAVVNLLP